MVAWFVQLKKTVYIMYKVCNTKTLNICINRGTVMTERNQFYVYTLLHIYVYIFEKKNYNFIIKKVNREVNYLYKVITIRLYKDCVVGV